MKNKSPDISIPLNPKTPWCPYCRAHIKISLQEGKKTCPQCGGTGVFIPRNLKIRYMVFYLTGAVFGGLAKDPKDWSGLMLLPAIFFAALGVRGQMKHSSFPNSRKEQVDASEGEPASGKRKRRMKKPWKKAEKTRVAEARRPKRFSPPPSPPPPPPEVDDN